MLTVSAAYFSVCPKCGCHGFVVTAAGARSRSCIAKDEAIAVARGMQSLNMIPADEMPELIRQINESSLSSDIESAKQLFDSLPPQELIEFLRRSSEKLRETREVSERAASNQQQQFDEMFDRLCQDGSTHKTLH